MKTSCLLFALVSMMSSATFAQTSATIITNPSNPPSSSFDSGVAGGTSTATSAASGNNDDKLHPVIRYMGYMHGVGLDFSGAHEAGINGDSQMTYEQRVKFLAGFSKNIEAGIEVRENTNFGNGQNANLVNGNWRLHSAFKNVLNSDVYNLILMPRILIPTSNRYHNQKTTLSPDPEVEFKITPRNSRFIIDAGVEYEYLLHTSGATGSDYANADTSVIAPWLEIDYQTTPTTQLMLSYWPQMNSHARIGVPLTSGWAQGGENEIDAGGYWEFTKGWQFNPYIAAEMSDIGAGGNSIAKNLQLNFLIIGRVL